MEFLYHSKEWALLMEFFLKSTLVLGFGLSLSYLCRRQSAAVRHFILGISHLGIVLLPFISVFLPHWNTSIFPRWAVQAPQSPLKSIVINPGIYGLQEALLSQGYTPTNDNTIDPGPTTSHTRLSPVKSFCERYALVGLWSVIAGYMLARILMGLYAASSLTRQGTNLEGYPWQHIFQKFIEKTKLRRKVRLIQCHQVSIPITWGLFNPVVLMPPASNQWPLEQRASVLFHELAHIKRMDFIVTMISRIISTIYWFNPLSRLVFKQLCKEQEKACDEMVLKTGIKPSTYASTLLQMKMSLDKKCVPSPMLGMAGHSELSDRLATILAKQFKIKEIKMKTKIVLLILVFLAVMLIGSANPTTASNPSDDKVASAQENEEKQSPSEEKNEKKMKTSVEKKEDKAIVIVNLKKGKKDQKGQKITILPANGKIVEKMEQNYVLLTSKGKQIKINCSSEKSTTSSDSFLSSCKTSIFTSILLCIAGFHLL